ncbi:hypothetical protein AB4G91_00700 [Macrococcoides goetzii]|uniref:hypothetical protein n=1 Tax=Macrococcus sp. PK TaxID=2801919 RepID=UPI001F10D91A|nr:hypothetical protein [Macrococcus sp. PK]MCH4983815.1 hypothetical protein [Macrococcus sp. PK]MCH4986038.1 hypothetical protein [Macrococcus sp. PK]
MNKKIFWPIICMVVLIIGIGSYYTWQLNKNDYPNIRGYFATTPEELKDKEFNSINEAADAFGKSISKEVEINSYKFYVKQTKQTEKDKVIPAIMTFEQYKEKEDKFTIAPFHIIKKDNNYKIIATGMAGEKEKYAQNKKIINMLQSYDGKDYSFNITKYKKEIANSDITFHLEKEKLYVGIMIEDDK